jgi:hypothetical protein
MKYTCYRDAHNPIKKLENHGMTVDETAATHLPQEQSHT